MTLHLQGLKQDAARWRSPSCNCDSCTDHYYYSANALHSPFLLGIQLSPNNVSKVSFRIKRGEGTFSLINEVHNYINAVLILNV